MKYGIISDIHGNLEALQAVMQRLQTLSAEKYIFCGDLIGYGPDPEACVQQYISLQKQGKILGVMGNHDAVFEEPRLLSFFNAEATASLRWSGTQLSPESLRALAGLPVLLQQDSFCVVHGTLRAPLTEYFTTARQYRLMEHLWDGQILFVGHSHQAFYMEADGSHCDIMPQPQEYTLSLQSGQRYLINPGSVGHPRDDNPQASCALWDSEAQYVQFLRVEYDLALTQKKMKKAGLPELLIDTLAEGR